MKVAWLTDLHFVSEGAVSGYDPKLRLDAAVAHINAHYSDCAFCVITGDVVDEATAQNYAGVKAALDRLAIPYFPMMGNHDERVPFSAAFGTPERAMTEFVQFSVETEAGLFVCLDTKTDGTDGGYLCGARLDWLRGVLERAGAGPVYVFLHHPPVDLGVGPFDEIGLENGAELIEILAASGQVVHIFAGHVHQAISGSVRGIPFTIGRAVIYQSRPSRPQWDWENFSTADVEPTYSVIDFEGGNVVVHSVPFCDAEFGKING